MSVAFSPQSWCAFQSASPGGCGPGTVALSLCPLNDPPGATNALFKLRPALTDTPGAVSFESEAFPGHFVRHNCGRVRVDALEQSSSVYLFDASFFPRAALSGDSGFFSYESQNYPNMYLRVRDNGQVWVDINEGTVVYKHQASFMLASGLPGQESPNGVLPCQPSLPSSKIALPICWDLVQI